MEKLKRYFDTRDPRCAFMITGQWGAGKSYWWRDFCAQIERSRSLPYSGSVSAKTRPLPKPICLSAAGLNCREDLESALFVASAKWTSNPFVKVGGIFARAMLRNGGVDPSEIKIRADISNHNAIVCIDDVERFSGDYREFFGFVIDLLDLHGSHVILICAEESMSLHPVAYSEGRERVVGDSWRVRVDAQELVDSVVNGLAPSQGLNHLKTARGDLAQIFQLSGVQNRRLAIAAIRAIRDRLDDVSDEEFRSIIPSHLFASIMLVVFARSTTPNCDAQLRLIFGAEGGSKPSLLSAGAQLNEVEQLTKELIERIGFKEIFYVIEASRSMLSFSFGDVVEKELLLAEFRGTQFESPPLDLKVIEAIEQLNSWETLESGGIDTHARTLKSALEGALTITFRQLESIVGLARWLDEMRLVDPDFGFDADTLSRLIEQLDPQSIIGGMPDLLGPHDGLETVVADALKTLYSRLSSRSSEASVEAAVESFMQGRMSVDDSVHIAFKDEDSHKVVEALFSMSAERLKELVKALRMFNVREIEGAPRGFEGMVSTLRARIPSSGRLTPSQAMVNLLAKEIEKRCAGSRMANPAVVEEHPE